MPSKLKAVTQLDALRIRQQDLALKIHYLGHRRPPRFAELLAEFKAISRQLEQQDQQQAS